MQQTFNEELLALPTREGRACVRGACSCACSRVTLPLASEALCARLVDHAVALQPPAADGAHNLSLKLTLTLTLALTLTRSCSRCRRGSALPLTLSRTTAP